MEEFGLHRAGVEDGGAEVGPLLHRLGPEGLQQGPDEVLGAAVDRVPGTARVPATEEVTRTWPRLWAIISGRTAAMA